MHHRVDRCRICKNDYLIEILDLGIQALTGVFPAHEDQLVTAGPLSLVKCMDSGDSGSLDVCGLVQLSHSFSLDEMYGDNYGYRSGLNASMVAHLQQKVKDIRRWVTLNDGDLVVDIGSNDGTTLSAYPRHGLKLIGVDPSGAKFSHFYEKHVDLIEDFFSSSLIKGKFGTKRAKVITSFSMFYDLEDPVGFAAEVIDILADDGIWVFEQSYLPAMLENNSYDTVCHEHLEYYALKQIHWIAAHIGFRILDVSFNDVNGGSFSVTAATPRSSFRVSESVTEAFKREAAMRLDELAPYEAFSGRVSHARKQLREFVDEAKRAGKRVMGLGASTKGNVILQFCGISSEDVSAIGEVNMEKIGRFTPGTLIPIILEDEILSLNPDYLLVLPWHFREFFLNNSRYVSESLVFPLPNVEVCRARKLG